MYGYAGKILRIDLTGGGISTIPTERYAHWGGGHGIGSAIFWDLVKEKNISGFDPGNVITIMTSPLSGTLATSASSRTEVQGIGVQSSPVEWFTRSNFGGRFGAMLKYAGWDGIVIEGKSKKPVWIDIRDGSVQIKEAGKLWGKDTWRTQQIIWAEVAGETGLRRWFNPGRKNTDGRTTQKPAVLAIGQAGENLSRIASLIHDAGNAAGQSGFGGVWGSKKLKAISVIGTGGVKIADPGGMIKARLWLKKHSMDITEPEEVKEFNENYPHKLGQLGMPSMPIVYWQRPEQSRPQACTGCQSGCRSRYDSGLGNESHCAETAIYSAHDLQKNSNVFARAIGFFLQLIGQNGAAKGIMYLIGKQTDAGYIATDLAQKFGINAFELAHGIPYMRDLYKLGVLGKGKQIECDLPFEKYGEIEFIKKLMFKTAYRKGIGDDIAEGFYRAAKKWGRLEEDLKTGLLQYPYWGLPEHHYDPRVETEWGYGSILGDRDINEHCFNFLYWMPSTAKWQLMEPAVPASEIVKIYSEKLKPFEGDLLMLDYSTGNMYSDHIVKLVSWHRRYSRFWKQSALFCDFRYPDFYNGNSPDNRGVTGEVEPRLFKIVTGKSLKFTEGIEIGRKIWNLDNAIWTLQGRHRDMVKFAEYIYKKPYPGIFHESGFLTMYYMPGRVNGEWDYIPLEGRHIDREKFEEWKTRYYKFEGWDPGTGWPEEGTLKELGLEYVARELKKQGKTGRKEGI